HAFVLVDVVLSAGADLVSFLGDKCAVDPAEFAKLRDERLAGDLGWDAIANRLGVFGRTDRRENAQCRLFFDPVALQQIANYQLTHGGAGAGFEDSLECRRPAEMRTGSDDVDA